MLKIAIILFREFVEISILLGIITAATNHIPNSKKAILLGVALGATAAGAFASSIKFITNSFGGLGDELFDVTVILLSVFFIIWTVIWMQEYSKKIKLNLSEVSGKVSSNQTGIYTLVILVATAILRESSEIILFVYSIISTNPLSNASYFGGIVIGVISGISVGIGLYFGLIKLAGKYIFSISSLLLVLIAAGFAAKAAGIMTSTGLVENFSEQLWDSSWLISDQSITGKTLNALTGYEAKPNILQAIFYFLTIILTYFMLKLQKIKNNK